MNPVIPAASHSCSEEKFDLKDAIVGCPPCEGVDTIVVMAPTESFADWVWHSSQNEEEDCVEYILTKELPGDAQVNISNEYFFTGNGNTFIYSEISKQLFFQK